MNNQDWDRAQGDPCPKCGQEAFRFLDGLCPACSGKKAYEEGRAMEYIAMAETYRAYRRRGSKGRVL